MLDNVKLLMLLVLALLTALLFGCEGKKELFVEEGTKAINGTELYYKILGEGEPIVVLHGGPGLDHSYFLPQMSELTKTHKLIFFDQRLCGRSSGDVDSSAISMDHFVEDLEGIRKDFGLEEMNLMAHSWGGVLAMFYARKYANNLRSLMLVNTGPASLEFQQQSTLLRATRFTPEDSLARAEIMQSEAFKQRTPTALAELFRISFRAVFYDRSLADSLTLELQPTFAANNAKLRYLFKDLASYDLHSDLAKIKCPTLIVHGDSDAIAIEALDKIRENISGSKFILLKNCGHFPFIESPDEFFAQIRSFLADLSEI
ncbi:alpha/beta fold hydrolase [bacterium]|nr:alpha/beta fold hydrolase [bacterium]